MIVGNGVPNALVGDGFCNDETNNAACNYDGGDCCSYEISKDYCSECNCYLKETCVLGILPKSVGDGFCNDETNIQGAKIDLNRNSIQDQTSIQILT